MAYESEFSWYDKVSFLFGGVISSGIINVHEFDELCGVIFQYAGQFDYFVGLDHFEYDEMTDVSFEERLV